MLRRDWLKFLAGGALSAVARVIIPYVPTGSIRSLEDMTVEYIRGSVDRPVIDQSPKVPVPASSVPLPQELVNDLDRRRFLTPKPRPGVVKYVVPAPTDLDAFSYCRGCGVKVGVVLSGSTLCDRCIFNEPYWYMSKKVSDDAGGFTCAEDAKPYGLTYWIINDPILSEIV
jgi:hypothetical protein